MSEPNLRAKDQSPAQTEFELYMVLILPRQCQIYEDSYLTVSATTTKNRNAGPWDLSINSVREMEGISTQGVHYS